MKAICNSCSNCGGCNNDSTASRREMHLKKHLLLRDKLDQYFKALVDLKSFNGCILIQQNGKEVLWKSYNIESDTARDLRVTIDSQFDIHSITKLFANIAILKLEERGKLKRSDFISKYFADFPNGNKITIQHLINHESGLPRVLSGKVKMKKDLNPDQIVALIKKEKLVFEPGTKVLYSNIGFQLIYFLIAQISNKYFSQFIKEEIFEKWGMTYSGGHCFSSNDNLLHHAQNHSLKNGEIISISDSMKNNFQNGHLYATVHDLMLALNHIKKEDGLWTKLFDDDKRVVGFAGGSEGIRSYVQIDKTLKYEFALLSNIDSLPLYKVIEDLPKIFRDEYYEMPSKITRKAINLSINHLKNFEGVYEFIDVNQIVVEFKVKNRRLVVMMEGDDDVVLHAESATVFFEDPDLEQWFEFEKTKDGQYEPYLIWLGNKWKGTKLN